MVYFTIANVCGELEKKNLGCEAGCGLTVSCSDHGRIGPALEMTFHQVSGICSEILQCNFLWQAQYLRRLEVDSVALRIVNEVSYVMRIQHVSLSA